MSLSAGTHKLGPDNASLRVKTYHEGVAAKAGHDLIMDVTQWGATLEVGEGRWQLRLELDADARSLRVREAVGGLKSLGERDRDEIRKNIDEQVLGGAPIYFRSDAVEAPDDDRLWVRGALKMHGQTHPASFELNVGPDGRVSGTAQLVQSEWGIKPYRGLMGALRVRDSLDVVFEGRLPVA